MKCVYCGEERPVGEEASVCDHCGQETCSTCASSGSVHDDCAIPYEGEDDE